MSESVPALEIRRAAVSATAVDDALRLINLDLLEHGASSKTLGEWLWSSHWFPHLNWRDEIVGLAQSLPSEWTTGQICDPQILLQFPHTGPKPDITFHVDREPDWADGRRYLRIVGIPLGRWSRSNGGLLVEQEDRVTPVELDSGDAVMMAPQLRHSGGLNMSGAIRYGVYLRWLAEGD